MSLRVGSSSGSGCTGVPSASSTPSHQSMKLQPLKTFQTPEHCDFPSLWPSGQDLQISHARTHTHTCSHTQARTEVHREPPLGLVICGGKKASIHRELYFCPSHLTLLPPEKEFLNTAVGFPGGSVVKNSPTNAGHRSRGFSPWVGKIPWRRKWKPTPTLLPGKCRGQRSLAGYGPWGHKDSDTSERLSAQ